MDLSKLHLKNLKEQQKKIIKTAQKQEKRNKSFYEKIGKMVVYETEHKNAEVVYNDYLLKHNEIKTTEKETDEPKTITIEIPTTKLKKEKTEILN